MESTSEVWTLGRWQAKPGSANDFIRAWAEFAAWTATNQEGARQAHLLLDQADDHLFYSFGPWSDQDAIALWRSTPEFAAFVSRVRVLCESFEPHTLNTVAGFPG